MNKPAYLGLLILEISKKVMYEFSYDYVKPKYREKSKLHYMGTGSFEKTSSLCKNKRHLCRQFKRC